MKVAIVSHKPCWRSRSAASGYATDGGFPLQVRALSGLFGETALLVPVSDDGGRGREEPLAGPGLRVRPLSPVPGRGLARKLMIPLWVMWNGPRLISEILRADAVHAVVPGDVGTLGMLLAWILRKPLLVRHCGNWRRQNSAVDGITKRFLEAIAGGRRVVLATGGDGAPPSQRNLAIEWIFSTSMSREEMDRVACIRRAPARDAVRLVIVCRQEERKGVDVVLGALPRLIEEGYGVALDVVGEGSKLEAHRHLAHDLGVVERVTFHGGVPPSQVFAHLKRADIFCFPTSASEGFPKAVLEALATGLPVVTTDVSGLRQLVEGGGVGIVLRQAAPDCLAEAVVDCLSDAERYQTMSRAAGEVAQRYTLEAWTDRLGRMLESAWPEWSAPPGPETRTPVASQSP